MLSAAQYTDACTSLTAWYGGVCRTRGIQDLDFTSPATFREARELVSRRQLDFSDAFQILSVKIGYFSRAVDDSRTLLVTADNPLAVAARAEGLRVWNVLTEAMPP